VPPRGLLPLFLLALLATATTLAIVEGSLRWSGQAPRIDLRARLYPNEPQLLDPDPILGWRSRVGRHVFPGYTPDAPPVRFTVWPGGERATSPASVERSERVVLLGDSITAGWAISDEETFGWKLQERFPDVGFLDYGTGGYGTYQSLLVMRELLVKGKAARSFVYGFIDDHEHRNVADLTWLRALAAGSRVGGVAVPYCLLARTGALDEHAPEPLPRWPLTRRLAITRLLEDRELAFIARGREPQGRPVTERLIAEMDRLARAHGSEFIAVFLVSRPEITAHYRSWAEAHRVVLLDCTRALLPDLVVPGEGHPNGRLHTEWAACIGDALATRTQAGP
jgi:hypothetical protein